jgi:hypothetical protein
MDRPTFERAVDALVATQRDRCLWFVRHDYAPRTDAERLWVLTQIQQRADRATFVRASELKRWLSPNSNAASVDSSPSVASRAENNTSRAG